MIKQQLSKSGQLCPVAQQNCYAHKPSLAVLRHADIAHLSLDHQLLSDYIQGRTLDGHANIQFGIGVMTHANKFTLLCAQHVLAASLVQLWQGLQASHMNCNWHSYLLAVKIPCGCDPQKFLA
jgi:hypothetical protein